MVVTLAAIEQETARRCGPFRADTASTTVASSTSAVVVDSLKSAIALGGYTDQYLLRRGTVGGAAIPGFLAADRVRRVKEYESLTGTLRVDRSWTNAPSAGEDLELHHLDPANELRIAVQHGLDRCFYVDRASVTTTAVAPERDLTAVAPWITDPEQVYEIQWQYPGISYTGPVDVIYWKAFLQAGDVWVSVAPDPFPNVLLVTHRRPASSLVNGATSTTGPTNDTDTLNVNLDYAVAAGHVEAWRRFPAKLAPAAANGLQMSQAMAAAEFTRESKEHFHAPQRRIFLDRPSYFGAVHP